ncbi:hypothetical protein [Burkholderia sp. A9]|uniref:hypothetical protein n=1 Tax=Burkholderia sp. A9 TaxID=1365108 RepID=UPI000B095BC5|nr:hypothetical protein [Burkholderia sp. A9]
MSIFFRLNGAQDKALALKPLCASVPVDDRTVFVRSVQDLLRIPGSPLAYWAAGDLVRTFAHLPSFEETGRFAGQGIATADNFRFLRLHWETPIGNHASWFGLAKGGTANAFYADVYLCIRWGGDGAEFKSWAETLYDNSHWSRITMNYSKYGLAGLTWSRRATDFAVRVLPSNCVFGDKGPAIFTPSQSPDSLLGTCALLNSMSFQRLLELQLARVDLAKSYETGAVSRTPMPEMTAEDESRIAKLARLAWSKARLRDTINEASHAFVLPLCLNERVAGVDFAGLPNELSKIRHEIDDLACSFYGLDGTVSVHDDAPEVRDVAVNENDESVEEGDDDSVAQTLDSLVSWLVGVSFGRFDPRLATGERAIPSEPEPFDPQPFRSPGMYPESDEPADRADILVNDEGHADDLATRVRAVAEHVNVDAPENLRAWLAKEFFPLHIKMYSKSRRKAPIYWQLATPTASYSVWLYIHAFSNDTFFRVQNDYAVPKLAHEERRLESLASELRDGATAAQRKELAAQESFVEELRAFLEEVKRVASLWKPNLDDGVIVNFAPLWRLVPQNKSWQRELKSIWDALCEGKYDWAHVAMHLWPERVIPKCTTDRSLAIAHNLEDVFWVEGTDGKWSARTTPTRSVEELVQERTSSAVKSALKGLLEAPTATGNAGRGRSDRRKTATERGNA